MIVTLAKKYVYFGESNTITNIKLWLSNYYQWLFCYYWNRRGTSFSVNLFGARLVTRFVLEITALTKSCNLSIYEYVHLSSKYLWIRFFKEKIFLLANADFYSVLYVFMPFFLHNASKDPLNSVPLSTHTFFGYFVVIFSLNASAVVVAYFDFKSCTLRYRDMQPTATSRYLASWLYLASLST